MKVSTDFMKQAERISRASPSERTKFFNTWSAVVSEFAARITSSTGSRCCSRTTLSPYNLEAAVNKSLVPLKDLAVTLEEAIRVVSNRLGRGVQ